ncbi:ATP-binding cassette sub-family B member 10, mitochondrial [Eurosta solidaginis]|uniref:ATP-binding cassette sub-family B member 10, mitochondrial n=1 Tax=Eurosta solidaginis TaxID=178769 RepID=UPI0035309491
MLIYCICFKGALTRIASYSNLRKPLLGFKSLILPINSRAFTVNSAHPQQKQIFCHFQLHTPSTFRANSCLRLARYRSNLSSSEQKIGKLQLNRKDVVRLIGLAKTEKWVLTAAMCCLVVSSAITMSVPFALGKILDMIFNKKETSIETMHKLKEFSIILLGVFIVGGLTNYLRVYLFNSASLRIIKDLRSNVYRRMLLQETGWFDTKGTGELLNRLVNDTYMVGNSLSQNLSDGLRSTVMIIAGTSMMIYTSPSLAVVSTCVVPCVAGMAIVYGRYVRNITRSLLDKFADISKSVEERLGNVKTVKGFCKEHEESKAYDALLTDALNLGYKEVQARSIFFGLTGFSGNVIIISVLYYGGTLVINDALSVGALTSFILYAGYSAISINGLSNFYTELNKGVGAAQRVWEILDRQYAIPLHIGILPKTPPRGKITFENVRFSFPARAESIILNNFNLTLQPGESTAVVGRSGSGKTTISTLLLRLYDPLQGRVMLDDIDLRELNPVWLRSFIGAVNQEPTLFSGTIRDNILYGLNPGTTISTAALEDVIKKAHVDEFTLQLPDGLNTLVGQRGLMLSGGQRQRVAIARALIKNPAILILDEATSALDSVSEELVQNAIEQVSKGRTVLTIAHRLSTIRNADKIAVLENGGVIEQGRYDDLITSKSGAFRDLVSKQAFALNS